MSVGSVLGIAALVLAVVGVVLVVVGAMAGAALADGEPIFNAGVAAIAAAALLAASRSVLVRRN